MSTSAKPRLLIPIVIVVILAGITWLSISTLSTPTLSQTAAEANGVPERETSLGALPQPELPEPTDAPTPKAPPPTPDPQLDVHTAMEDMLTLLRSGDLVNFAARYMPPDARAELANNPERLNQIAARMANALVPGTPEFQETQQLIQALEVMRGSEPVLNATGDKAVYGSNPKSVRFIKVDGRWYFEG